MHYLTFALALLLPVPALMTAPALAAAESPTDGAVGSVPSYSAALAAFQAERAEGSGPVLSDADRAVMAEAAAALAAAMPSPGLAVGTPAPDFALPNAVGETVRLHDLLADGPVVLTFYRGAWCPYCNLQLRVLQQTLPRIEAAGAQLLAVTPQRPDRSLAQVEADGYPFEILSDLDDAVMRAYDLFFEVPADLDAVYRERLGLDLAEYNGPGRNGLPVPGTFVIDTDGIIRAAFADVDYRARMEPAAILDALSGLPASAGAQP